MKIKLLFIILISLTFGCNSNNEFRRELLDKQYACISDMAVTNGKSSEGKEFSKQLKDTLNSWKENVDMMRSYKERKYELSTNILFNSQKNKGIGMIIKYREENETTDAIKIVTGQKVDGVWKFYYLGNYTLLFSLCDDCPEKYNPIPKEDIEKRGLKNIISAGYFKDIEGCVIDDERFETDWVSEYKIKDHEQRFLSGTYPKIKGK